jgi:hypothetical protein
MGGWCGAHMADTARKKTGMRLRLQVGASVPGGTPRKKLSKVVEGEVLLLDRSLLMGAFPIHRPAGVWYSTDPHGVLDPTSVIASALQREHSLWDGHSHGVRRVSC